MHSGYMTKRTCKLGVGAVLGWLGSMTAIFSANAAIELAAPFPVHAGSKPIDVTAGHAAPWLMDFDGDGLTDLLVGQFDDCKLRIYRNTGSKSETKFDVFGWFRAGTSEVKLPGG
jgi:hypothetical protein